MLDLKLSGDLVSLEPTERGKSVKQLQERPRAGIAWTHDSKPLSSTLLDAPIGLYVGAENQFGFSVAKLGLHAFDHHFPACTLRRLKAGHRSAFFLSSDQGVAPGLFIVHRPFDGEGFLVVIHEYQQKRLHPLSSALSRQLTASHGRASVNEALFRTPKLSGCGCLLASHSTGNGIGNATANRMTSTLWAWRDVTDVREYPSIPAIATSLKPSEFAVVAKRCRKAAPFSFACLAMRSQAPDLTPGHVYQKRTRGDQAGFPADHRYWESIVPTRRYEDGPNVQMTSRSIELTPISLGWKDARHRRGRPRLAGMDGGNAILERFAELSRPFGTELCSELRAVRLA
ncbi:MAG: hypothetical protein JSR91_08500 [Proteobacteria bacterium]|nr:hypothetical protein [Pseudomonadota bacterium]